MAIKGTIRTAYEAYLRGEASLDEVVITADRFAERYATQSVKPAAKSD